MYPSGDDMPWWAWLFPVALVLGLIVRIIWVWRRGGFRQADTPARATAEPGAATYPEVWARAMEGRTPEVASSSDSADPASITLDVKPKINHVATVVECQQDHPGPAAAIRRTKTSTQAIASPSDGSTSNPSAAST